MQLKPRQHYHGDMHSRMQLPITLLTLLWLTNRELALCGVHADAANLLRGGNFADNPIQFGVYPVLDVLAHGIKTQLPYWTCVHGGVQLWDASVYVPLPSDKATFVLHLNSRAGGGHVVSVPMLCPRANAEYVVSLSAACNPHGGPRNQSLLAIVFDDEGEEMQPRASPIVLVSNANSSMENLNWERRSFKMLGTGRRMYLYLVSLVKGYYGVLVANVQVNLVNLMENGSFETMALEAQDVFDILTMDVTLVAPRPRSISGWNVQTGKIKIMMTGPNKIFQSATDGGQYAIELNANHTSGEISAMFVAPVNTSISNNHEYALLFDAATNPRQLGPQSYSNGASAYAILGKLSIKVVGLQSNKQLLNEEYDMNSTGFSPLSVGWMTVTYSFKMEEDRTAQVSFRSLVDGMSFGPFLDNVAVYEVKDRAEWIKVNTPGYEPPKGNHATKSKTLRRRAEEIFLGLVLTTAGIGVSAGWPACMHARKEGTQSRLIERGK